MKRSTLTILICVAVLVTAVAVLAALNSKDAAKKQELEMNAQFYIKYAGKEQLVSMQDMLDIEPVEFTTMMDTSTTDPTQVTFTGVEIKKLCSHFGIDTSAATVYEVTALDGYSSALTQDEVQTDDNVYICILKNGEVLKTKSEGGSGPYMMIIKSSQFSNRWCKFVQEINIR